VLICTTIIFGLAAVVAKRWPDEWRADTLILVDPQKVPERYVNTTVSMDVTGRLSTINQQLMSSTRLQRIIDTYDLYKSLKGRKTQEEIIEQMRKDIKVDIVRDFQTGAGGPRNLGAFRITYMGRQPSLVAQVCNQLASLFIEENLKVREAQAEGTSEFIDTRLELTKKALEERENELRDFKVKNMGQLPEQQPANIATLQRLQTQLQAETDALARAHQSETFIQAQLASMNQNPAPGATTAADVPQVGVAPLPISENLVRLRQQRKSLEDMIQTLSLKYHAEHPEIRRATMLLAQVNKQIEGEESRLAAAPPAAVVQASSTPAAGGTAERPEATRDPLAMARAQLRVLKAEIAQRQQNIQNFNNEIRVYQARLEAAPMREQEMAQTTRDAEILRDEYKSLLEKKQSADMAADLEKRQKSERFTILDPARIPEKPFRPNRPAILAASLALGLAMGVGMVFVTEMRDRTIKKEDEIVRHGLRVLGRIPMVVTSEESLLRRRRRIRNWVLGTAATMGILTLGSLAAYFVTKAVFLL
jgi:polysaccharide chain length determinant protein (PEP-CTERM system associated)